MRTPADGTSEVLPDVEQLTDLATLLHSQTLLENIQSGRKGSDMSHYDTKLPRRFSGAALPNTSEDEPLETLDRAEVLIRALDLESRAHMAQISVEEKGSVPEDSAL